MQLCCGFEKNNGGQGSLCVMKQQCEEDRDWSEDLRSKKAMMIKLSSMLGGWQKMTWKKKVCWWADP